MQCPKVLNIFHDNFQCPNEDIFTPSICTSNWVTLIGGASIQVCASAKLWLLFHGYTERWKDEQEKEQEKQTNAPKK